MKRIYINIIIFIVMGCNMNNFVIKRYIDGNGNAYNFNFINNEVQIEYIPVKAEESSSGLYSGGEYKTVYIKHEDFLVLKSIIESSIKNDDEFSRYREKGTGLIILIKGKDEKKFILKHNSIYKKKIEDELKKIID